VAKIVKISLNLLKLFGKKTVDSFSGHGVHLNRAAIYKNTDHIIRQI